MCTFGSQVRVYSGVGPGILDYVLGTSKSGPGETVKVRKSRGRHFAPLLVTILLLVTKRRTLVF